MSKQQQWMRNRPDGPLHKADISCESNGCWPVAVIDVEDREQVADLMGKFSRVDGRIFGGAGVTDMQAALREFAAPRQPKPEEPTGLGAVVEDDRGTLWTRVESGEAETRNPWYPARVPDWQPDEWDRIDVVRVLSEGVQPGDPR